MMFISGLVRAFFRSCFSGCARAFSLLTVVYLEVHAKAAGAAARRAKESYELAMRSSREMAEYAGKLVRRAPRMRCAGTQTVP